MRQKQNTSCNSFAQVFIYEAAATSGMTNHVSRRRLCSTIATGTIVNATAGCLGSRADEESDSPCEVGTAALEAVYSGEFETAAGYIPYEYGDDVDRAAVEADLEAQFAETAARYDLESVTCGESTAQNETANELSYLLEADVARAPLIEYEITLEHDEETTTHQRELLLVEIDNTWYAAIDEHETGG